MIIILIYLSLLKMSLDQLTACSKNKVRYIETVCYKITLICLGWFWITWTRKKGRKERMITISEYSIHRHITCLLYLKIHSSLLRQLFEMNSIIKMIISLQNLWNHFWHHLLFSSLSTIILRVFSMSKMRWLGTKIT